MKISGVFLIVLFLLPFIKVAGQTVSIPDPNLKACILEKHPNTLDASQNLILSEAAQVAGAFNCNGRNIQNAEGIQYFTGVTEIHLGNNQLTFLPELSALPQLTVLIVPDNQLAALPDFSNLTNLASLDVRRNRLQALPDLSNNSSLVSINAHTNQFETLPNLDALTNLTYLNVAINNLTQLPDLSNLTSLRELRCWRNQLTGLPPLFELNNLRILDAATNQISALPPFSASSQIEIIYLERNLLNTLPDFTVCSKLRRARLYNNKLTFEDLIPLASIPGYDTTFPANTQKKISIAKTLEVLETEKLILQTGVDNNIDGVTYEWIYNGQMALISPDDTVSALTSSVDNTGYYYCRMTHPAFPELILETDSIVVKVLPCINETGFSTAVTSSTCLQAGSLTIKSSNQPSTELTYHLKSTSTGKTFTSETGFFKDLNEPEYTLTVQAGENCYRELSNKINIPIEKCKDAFITPNGDGVDDAYYFTQSGQATISDKWGNTIKTLSIPGEWNGNGKFGAVSPGLYIVNINNGEDVIKMSVIY